MLNARLLRFAAWAPGIEDAAAWQRWSQAPGPIGAGGNPEARFVPPMLRRRCTPLSRAMLQVAFEACPEERRAQVRSVFASRHGENQESLPLFTAIAHEQPLSPAKFTHTVHNAQAGLFSIAAGNRQASSSLSGEVDTFASGWLEALAHLERDPTRAVLYVIGDVPVAPLFQHLVGEPASSYAVGLLLAAEASEGEPIDFALRHRAASDAGASPALAWPQALEFVRWLHTSEERSLTLTARGRVWSWTRDQGTPPPRPGSIPGHSLRVVGCPGPDRPSDGPGAAAGSLPAEAAPVKIPLRPLALALCALALAACDERPREDARVYEVANRCLAVGATDPGRFVPKLLSVTESGDGYAFARRGARKATPFFLKPSRLGTYLLYDDAGSYLVSDGAGLLRQAHLLSDVLTVDDHFESEAEWVLESRGRFPLRRLVFRHRKSGRFLATAGLVDDAREAAHIRFYPSENCAEFPEATLDADGRVEKREFPDGSLFGFVDTHSHILSNFGFGGGGIFHGAPFHPLGIEHALSDCSLYHGAEGRKDLFGYGFDNPNANPFDFLLILANGELPFFNHATAGWPEFTDWPSAFDSSTHQVQYYQWLERAYLGGLRLVVQHATSNQIICDLLKGAGVQPTRYACNDMVAVDRIIQETYNMEAYIDAQEGGPGRGWFRIVKSPAEARRVIRGGKMAVVLGIETSNLFDCFLVPSAEHPACTEQDVVAALDRYHALGIRVIFPVHKYDNAFSAGDGQKFFIELGNFAQTGHFSNYTPECDPTVPAGFDGGAASFPGLNQPRADYFAPPLNDTSGFADDPLGTLLPYLGLLLQPSTGQEVCQAAGLTPLGEFLMAEMMKRGMIIEVDHLPRRSYKRAYEILAQNDYPAAGTHGRNNFGALYRLGGVSASGFGRCRAANASATMDDGFQNRIQLIEDNGGFPAEGFGFDLNGFAGAPGPRFGPKSVCGSTPQTDPVTYPFKSYAGDVTFYEPHVGNRTIDFNSEGMAHIGLVPELIEDVRRDGVSDAELEPLFKSAEGYIRMWEKAELRAGTLRR